MASVLSKGGQINEGVRAPANCWSWWWR